MVAASVAGSWYRGIKCLNTCAAITYNQRVAPYAGAWIETMVCVSLQYQQCRPLRGGVD